MTRPGSVIDRWQSLQYDVRAQWSRLTDSDVEYVAGNGERLIGLLQARYGFTRSVAMQEVIDWSRSLVWRIRQRQRQAVDDPRADYRLPAGR